jgi:hypothetical protein
MIGGSQRYTVRLEDNTIYVINVKRPQFLLSSLKRRTEYLFSISENTQNIVNDYNIDDFANTLFAIWNIYKMRDFKNKLNTLISTNINSGVNTTRDEMHIIGLQMLLNQLTNKIIIDQLQITNGRLQKQISKGDTQSITFTSTLPQILEEGGFLHKKSIRNKSIRNKSR